jgi:hypothetical protein
MCRTDVVLWLIALLRSYKKSISCLGGALHLPVAPVLKVHKALAADATEQ